MAARHESVSQCTLAPMQPSACVPPGTYTMTFPGDDVVTHGATRMLVQMAGAPSGSGYPLVYFSCGDCVVTMPELLVTINRNTHPSPRSPLRLHCASGRYGRQLHGPAFHEVTDTPIRRLGQRRPSHLRTCLYAS